MDKKSGDIPVLIARGNGIPEAWERSLIELNDKGLWYPRGGRKDAGNYQVNATMITEIKNLSENPILHGYAIGGWDSLFEYQMEMLGAKDSWGDRTGETNRWPYQYYERLADYPGSTMSIDQIEEGIVKKLTKRPDTRQALAITWVPERDNNSIDPPCLQNIHCELVPLDNPDKGPFVLNMNYAFRSRNAMIAAPMNMLGLWTVQTHIMDRLSEESGFELYHGRLADMTYAYHVKASDQPLFDKFIKNLNLSNRKGETVQDRNKTREMDLNMLNSSRDMVTSNVIHQTENYLEGEKLEAEQEKISRISKIVYEMNNKYLSTQDAA